jgi:hypothetical protein
LARCRERNRRDSTKEATVAGTGKARPTRLKSSDARWLSDREKAGGLATEQYLYDNRYLETRTYDPKAPEYRRWTVVARDRKTGAQATVSGPQQRTSTAAALRQVGR